MNPPEGNDEQRRTIADFGEQWSAYRDNEGYYGSLELFRDMFQPLVSPEEVAGRRVADIGSGTGRIAGMLLAAGAARVLAVEPSKAFEVLRANLAGARDRVALLNAPGEALPPTGDLDFIFSYGVLHHIVDPLPTARAAFKALRPGGKLVLWLYGREGNRFYLALVLPLRAVTKRLPHGALAALTRVLCVLTDAYVFSCRFLPLPMRRYMLGVMAKLPPDKRRLNIYDQLNPAYAKYYSRRECVELMEAAGFSGVELHHRHGYSWSVVGTKPGQ
jgi:SAM-dependent methyltransferase